MKTALDSAAGVAGSVAVRVLARQGCCGCSSSLYHAVCVSRSLTARLLLNLLGDAWGGGGGEKGGAAEVGTVSLRDGE